MVTTKRRRTSPNTSWNWPVSNGAAVEELFDVQLPVAEKCGRRGRAARTGRKQHEKPKASSSASCFPREVTCLIRAQTAYGCPEGSPCSTKPTICPPSCAARPDRPSSASCASGSCGEAREAIETYGMMRARGALAGLPVGRQGQLHAAGRRCTELQWRGLLPVEHARLQSRSGPAGLSRDGAARVPDADGRAAPDRVSGHLFGRHRQDPAGPDLLRALLAAPARQSLPDRARGRLHGRRAGPPPRRHPRDVLHEPLPRRQAGHDAAEAAERGRRSLRLPPARPRGRGRLRALRQGDELSRSSPATSAAARRGCSACRSRRCSTGGRRTRPAAGR